MNIDWMWHLPAFMRRAIYFWSQTFIGSRVHAVWKEFLSWETLNQAEHDKKVSEKLACALENAVSNSPYYRRMNLPRRGGESAREWLKRFPILERTEVRQHFVSIVADAYRREIESPQTTSPKKYGWLIVKTGGTTGVPTTVVHDARNRDWGRATRLYGQKQCGFPLGVRYFKLWGSERDLMHQQNSIELRAQRALHGEIPLNAFRAREEDLLSYIEIIRTNPGIKNLMAYVDAAASLAMFINERKLDPPKFLNIMACAGTVTQEYRKLLRETFSARVLNKYGSRECCDMACECAEQNGMHVYSPHVYIEIVDEQGRECPPGKPGRILVTMLNNMAFPMVRYSIGDIGVWAEPAPCPCGSPFPRMENVLGRQDDMLTTEDGTLQSSSFIRHFVGVSLNWQQIREWQFEQTGPKEFIFRYVPLSEDRLQENLAKLKESFKLVFGISSSIEMRKVAEIQPSASGKVQWIINRTRKA